MARAHIITGKTLLAVESNLIIFNKIDVFYCFSDGDKYDGDWRNDERHGHGVMTYCGDNNSIQEKYEGEWVEGRMQGK